MRRIYVYVTSEKRTDEIELIIRFLRLYWDNFSVVLDVPTAHRLSRGRINPHGGYVVYVELGDDVTLCYNIFDLTRLFESKGLIPC